MIGGGVFGDRKVAMALGAVVVVLVVAHWPLFVGEIVFFRDPAHWNYSARWFLRESVLRGDLPFWNPEQGLGFSVLGNPLYGLFYPPNWLYLLVPRGLVASMLGWQSFAHVVWGSAGVLVLARQLRLAPAAAAVAAVAWGLSGYTSSAWNAGLLVLSGAWVPWCAVGFVRLARRVRVPEEAAGVPAWLGALAVASLPVAMAILLGEVFAALMAVGFGAAITAVALRHDRAFDPGLPGARRTLRRVAGALLAAVALGAGVGAVVVLPGRAIAAATARAAPLARSVAEAGSLHPLRLIELAAPGSMGHPFHDYAAGPWVGEPLIDGRLPFMFSVYLGASVLALVWVALGRRRALPLWLGVVALAVLLISMGRHTPVHHWMRTVVRPLAYMRYPEKYLVLLVGAVALMAGVGAQRVFGEGEDRSGTGTGTGTGTWKRTLGWLGGLVALAVFAGVLFPDGWARHARAGAIHGAAAVTLVVLVMLLARRRRRVAEALLVVAVGADLAVAASADMGFGPRAVATEVPRAAAAIVADHRRAPAGEALAPPRLYRAPAVETSVIRFVPVKSRPQAQLRSMQTLIENAVTTFGIATVPGYDAAIPTAVADLWALGGRPGLGQSVLRLLGIDYAVLPIDDPASPTERRRALEPMLDPLPGARLYRVPAALPRLYVAGRAEVVADVRLRQRLFDADVVAGQVALLSADPGGLPPPPPPPPPADAVSPPAGSCSLTAFTNVRLAATCRLDRPAVVVFNEQHDAGWTAAIDGAPAPLVRANLLMRAVKVDRGTHTVVLSYTPPGLRAAAVVSLASLCVVGACALAPRLRRRRSGP